MRPFPLRLALAPAAAGIGRLRYAHKFVVVGLVLVVPLGLLAGAYVHLHEDQIAFSAQERSGVAYLAPLNQLAAALVTARRQATASATTPPVDLSAQLTAVDAADRRHGDDLGMRSAWAATRSLITSVGSEPGIRHGSGYHQAVRAVLALIIKVGDASNLTLDPDLDTFYLMDMAQFELPRALDAATRTADAPGTATNTRVRLGVAQGTLVTARAALAHDLAMVAKHSRDARVKQVTAANGRRLLTELDDFIRKLDVAVATDTAAQPDPEPLRRQIAATSADACSSLDRLLRQRIDRLSDGARMVAAGALLGAAVAAYLFMGFYLSVVVPVRRIVTVLRAVASGDLSRRVQVDTRDELAFVAEVLNETVTLTQRTTDRLTLQATHDPLTGLPNRALVLRWLEDTAEQGEPGTVLFIDLDRFKLANDSFGHECGDLVLQEVSYRLSDLVPPNGKVGRLAGDEFVMVTTGTDLPDEARRLAMRIVHRLSEPIGIGGQRSVTIGASIGIAAFDGPQAPAEELLRRADLAMYQAKQNGRNQAEVYGPHLSEAAQARLRAQNELHEALESNAIIAHYQPIVDVIDGRLVGFEALARWQHPTRGLVEPAEFIGSAEENGMILPLGAQMLSQACSQLAVWHARQRTAEVPYVSVNVSAIQLGDQDFCSTVAAELERTGVAPATLHLEITETALMADSQQSQDVLHRLNELGVQLAIDDFGVGYSSLSYLSRFPIHALKLDRSFVAPLPGDRHARAVVSLLVGLGRALDLSIVAEGVETRAQREALTDLGCTTMQGYLFGRAAPPDTAWSAPREVMAAQYAPSTSRPAAVPTPRRPSRG